MIRSGLLSVTFRQLSPREIINLACRAELCAIEWGGDVHVPHGDLAQARTVRRMSEDAGLSLPTYGSYYCVGHADTGPFDAVLGSAQALGVSAIRVWAGRVGSADADEGYRQGVVEDSRRIVDMAATVGINIAYEYHGNTLTDTIDSTLQLLSSVERPYLRSFWQPPKGSEPQENLDAIQRLAPWIEHIHVFSWRLEEAATVRLPLAEHADQWLSYLSSLQALPGDRYALLEFVRNDDPEQFLADAAVLSGWLHAAAD